VGQFPSPSLMAGGGRCSPETGRRGGWPGLSLSGFRLRVRFNDGTEGTVELAGFLNSASAGVIAVLRDESLFRQARVELGAVIRPENLDLAPDVMQREIKEHGRWIVQ
jgi:hypothetical protein